MSSSQRQLPLDIRLRDESTLDNFLTSPEVELLLAALQDTLQTRAGQGDAVIYLYGPEGSGKSHLLQGACHLAGSEAVYLPLAELAGYAPQEVLQGVESLALVCLDDVDAVLGDADWELALFNLYNRAREADCRLLVAGNAAPRVLDVGLEDLRSRLSWGIVYQLAAADDARKAAILQFRAARRGLQLPAEVASYITSRAPRALDQLLELLERLDRASLTEQRALSVPFVRQTLGW